MPTRDPAKWVRIVNPTTGGEAVVNVLSLPHYLPNGWTREDAPAPVVQVKTDPTKKNDDSHGAKAGDKTTPTK